MVKLKTLIHIETEISDDFDIGDAIAHIKETVEKAQEFSKAHAEVDIPSATKLKIL